jgi:spore germination protein
VATVGTEGVTTVTWPTITLIRSFEITGVFFERFESFLLAVWILQIFTTYVACHYLASLGLANTFGKQTKTWIYWISPLVYIAAIVPQDINDLFKVGDMVSYAQLILVGIIVPILWGLALLRRKRYG